MKQWIAKHKKVSMAVLVVMVLLFALLVGGILATQCFYGAFLAAEDGVKTAFGIPTKDELALKAEQDALLEAALVDGSLENNYDAIVVADSEADAENAEDASELDTSNDRIVTINGMRTAIDLSAASYTWFDARQISTETTNEFTLTGDFSGYDVWFDGQAIATGETVSFEVETIAVNSGIELTLVSQETGDTTKYFMRTLNADYNTVTSGEGEGDGYYYFAQSNHLYKMDTAGNLVFFKTVDSRTFDFEAYQFNGDVYYTYMERVVNEFDASIAVSSIQTKAIVMDSNYRVIEEITALSTDMGMAEYLPLDMHEFVMLGVDHYILCAYVGKEVDNIPAEYNETGVATLATTVIQEVKDGEVIFQWQSSDYTEFYDLNYLNNPNANDLTGTSEGTVDYIHFNSIEVDPNDNNFILSFRRICAGVKIDRTTGEIIWVFGGAGDGFSMETDQKFSRQHTIYHADDDDTITVFDNGNAFLQTYFRSYVLDEETMSVVEYECYEVEGKFCSFMGSLQRLDDDALYLIGWGGGSADGVLLTEVDFATGATSFEVMDPDAVSVSDDNSYRVYKFDF